MPKKLVTEEMVAQVAEELRTEGAEPTTKKLKERLGAGSYTTIQRYLELWREKQTQLSTVPLPEELSELARRFACGAWDLASRVAAEEVNEAKQQAAAIQAAARTEIQDACAEIRRLERVVSEQEAELSERATAQQQAQIDLAQLRVEVGRISGLEAALRDCQEVLTVRSEEAARYRGEADALKAQLSALLASLPELQARKPEKPIKSS